MKKEELLKILETLANESDIEKAHSEADDALLLFIDDRDIEAAYNRIEKWYA